MNLLLVGACGRMGRAVVRLSAERGDSVVCGVDRRPVPLPFPVVKTLGEVRGTFDCAIDFSSPEETGELLAFCRERSLPLVLGTTGLSVAKEDLRGIGVAVFAAGNFSLGANVLRLLTEQAAALLDYDAEIIEIHHKNKKDAPSGTAMMLAESIESARGRGGRTCGRTGERRKGEIGLHAVRGGGVVGRHEVLFLGERETLTLTHTALGREIFAEGALIAAHFLAGKPAGLYGMDDLLLPTEKKIRQD